MSSDFVPTPQPGEDPGGGQPPPPPPPWMTGAVPQEEGPGPIGVEPGYTAQVTPQNQLTQMARGAGIPTPTQTFDIDPRYFEGDQYAIFHGLAPENIGQVQAELVAAGLLQPGGFRAGVWDPETAEAMKGVLGYANRTGTGWRSAIGQLQTNVPDPSQQRPGFVGGTFAERPFLPPDPEGLKNAVRQAARSELGRDLKDYEVDYLSNEMLKMTRREFEETEEQRRAEFEAEEEARRGTFEAEGQAAAGEDVGERTVRVAGTGEQYDAAERFATLFRERYAKERDMRGRVEVGQQVSNILRRGGGLVSSMTGGR